MPYLRRGGGWVAARTQSERKLSPQPYGEAKSGPYDCAAQGAGRAWAGRTPPSLSGWRAGAS